MLIISLVEANDDINAGLAGTSLLSLEIQSILYVFLHEVNLSDTWYCWQTAANLQPLLQISQADNEAYGPVIEALRSVTYKGL